MFYVKQKAAEILRELRWWDAEGRVTTRCMGVRKIYNDGSFNTEEWVEGRIRHHIVLGVGPTGCVGTNGTRFRDREKSEWTRLTNVESEYDPKTNKKQRGLHVLSWPCVRFVEVERRSKALWIYHIWTCGNF